jgi:4-alpha-glucanotransferase
VILTSFLIHSNPYFWLFKTIQMALERNSGVLLHVSSLPGDYGIGDFGPSAYRFVDWLAGAGFRLWQILPLSPLGMGNSPYQSFSVFAGERLYISPDELVNFGLLNSEELLELPRFNAHQVDFEKVRQWKDRLFCSAFRKFQEEDGHWSRHEYQSFLREHGWWLTDFALFMAIMQEKGTGDWSQWGEALKDREPDEIRSMKAYLKEAIEYEQFLQFMFFKQDFNLKNYANSKGIQIFGDMPLYVSYESSDVWSNQELFLLGADGRPSVVGGVPPDYFSEDGQLWGNPVYNWDALAAHDYHWWIARLYFNLHLFNLVRIDHFRGLESYWEIPANSETAKNGRWVQAHGHALLSIMKSRIDNLPIVAEDLGIITHEVEQLRDRFGLPGMKVLQFAFAEDGDGVHLPPRKHVNNLVYTGTHDNNTLKGGWGEINSAEKSQVLSYIGGYKGSIPDRLITLAWSSVAKTAIVPMQDVLQLGTAARMNTPGVAEGNWGWRFSWNQLNPLRGKWFIKLNQIYQRC